MKNRIMKGSLGDKAFRLAGLDEQSDPDPSEETDENPVVGSMVASGILAGGRSGKLAGLDAVSATGAGAPTPTPETLSTGTRSAEASGGDVLAEILQGKRLAKAMPVDHEEEDLDRLLDVLETALRASETGGKLSPEESQLVGNVKSLASQLAQMKPNERERETLDSIDGLMVAIEEAEKRPAPAKLEKALVGPFERIIGSVLDQDRALKSMCASAGIGFPKSDGFELSQAETRAVEKADRLGRIVGASRLGHGLRLALKHSRRNAEVLGGFADLAAALGMATASATRSAVTKSRDGSVAAQQFAKERERRKSEVRAMLGEGPETGSSPRSQAREGSREIARFLFSE